ncbi:MAG: hypothetical protein WKF78_02810 [Candidatus Limnocylindrales bacterium]
MLQKAQADNRGVGFDLDLSFYTRCMAIVATGSALYEPLYRAPIQDVKQARGRGRGHGLRVEHDGRDAFIDSSAALPSAMVIIPLVSHLALRGLPSFQTEQRPGFLHWMYAALIMGPLQRKHRDQATGGHRLPECRRSAIALARDLIAERGRIKVEAKDLEGAGIANPFFPMTYIVARSRGATDWFNGVPLYQKAIGKSFGLEIHHIFPQGLLYKSGM